MNLVRQSAVVVIVLVFQVLTWGQGATPTPTPEKNAEAIKLFTEAETLFNQGTPESLRTALAKFRSAVELFQQIGEKNKKAESMLYSGVIEGKLGDNAGALKTYEAVLPLLREVGNRNGEAVTLNNIGLIYAD